MQLMVDSNAGREQKFFKGRQLTQVEMFVGAVVRDNPSGLLELSGRECQLIIGNTEVRLLVYSIQSEFSEFLRGRHPKITSFQRSNVP